MDEQKKELENALGAVRKVAEQYEATEEEINAALAAAEESDRVEEDVPTDMMEDLQAMIIPQTSGEMSTAIINEAYDRLFLAGFNLWDAKTAETDVESDVKMLAAQLQLKRAKAVMDGTNPGKNEDQREAFNRETFKEEYAQLDKLQQELDKAKAESAFEQLAYDIAHLNVERVERVLKFFDIQTTIGMISAAEKQAAPVAGAVLKVKH